MAVTARLPVYVSHPGANGPTSMAVACRKLPNRTTLSTERTVTKPAHTLPTQPFERQAHRARRPSLRQIDVSRVSCFDIGSTVRALLTQLRQPGRLRAPIDDRRDVRLFVGDALLAGSRKPVTREPARAAGGRWSFRHDRAGDCSRAGQARLSVNVHRRR